MAHNETNARTWGGEQSYSVALGNIRFNETIARKLMLRPACVSQSCGSPDEPCRSALLCVGDWYALPIGARAKYISIERCIFQN